MSKYEPLKDYLLTKDAERIPMTFAEIERILGSKLPSSSATHRAWWSNNPSNNVMTKAWLAAGYETGQVDLGGGKLVFHRVGRTPPGKAANGSNGSAKAPGKAGKERLDALLAGMCGLLTLAPDYRPDEPLGEEWPEPYLGEEEVR